MYLDTHYFPIYLFNRYNDRKVESFSVIKKLAKTVQRNTKYDFGKTFHPDYNKELFANALTHFPFIFFLTESLNINSLPRLFKDNPRISNPQRLFNLYNKRISMKLIYAVFKQINETEGCFASRDSFIDDLFQLLYKFAFYEVAISIRLSDNNYLISDYIHDYKNYEKRISDKRKNSFMAQGQLIQSAFDNCADAPKMMTELKIISKSHYFSKLLFTVINRNIELNESFSTRIKNEMLRPLFFEIICNLCYPQHYKNCQSNDPFLVEKFRLFLREYNKN